MIVKAKYNFKYNDDYHEGGSVFFTDSVDGFAKCVEILDAPKPMKVEAPKVEAPKAEATEIPKADVSISAKRRTRTKKTTE